MMSNTKQIAVPFEVWEALNGVKLYPRETHGDVLRRLLGLDRGKVVVDVPGVGAVGVDGERLVGGD